MTIRDIALDVALNLNHSGMVIAITEEGGQLMGWYTHNSTIPLKGEIGRIPLGLEHYGDLLSYYSYSDAPIELAYSDMLECFIDDFIEDLTPAVEAVINSRANA